MMKKFRFIFMAIFICLMITSCGGHHKQSKRMFYGSELVKYSLILEENNELDISIPIITNKAIEKMEFLTADFSDGAELGIELTDPNYEEKVKYKKHYAYMPIFTLKNNTLDAVETKIEAIHMLIDGERVDFVFKDFEIVNDKALLGGDKSEQENGVLFIDGEYTLLWPKIPNGDGIGGRSFELELMADEEINLDSFKILGSFVTFDTFLVNGKGVSQENINISVEKGGHVFITGKLFYEGEASPDKIVRASYMVSYTAGDKRSALTVNSGIYIWDDYAELYDEEVMGPLKRFIDSLM